MCNKVCNYRERCVRVPDAISLGLQGLEQPCDVPGIRGLIEIWSLHKFQHDVHWDGSLLLVFAFVQPANPVAARCAQMHVVGCRNLDCLVNKVSALAVTQNAFPEVVAVCNVHAILGSNTAQNTAMLIHRVVECVWDSCVAWLGVYMQMQWDTCLFLCFVSLY